MSDWNTSIIEEFRANDGRVGGNFEGAPMVLLHHTGRKSGKESVTPLMYLDGPDAGLGADTIVVFASFAGEPRNPAWYYNLKAAGQTTVEVGAETYPVTVQEITGADRDRIFAEQVSRYPGFGGYEEKTAGIRTIPVLALHRS